MASLISWFTGHETFLAMMGVAVLDYLFSINEGAKSNSVLHWIYLQLQALAAPILPKP